jgi:hypothetical protein
MVILHMQIQNDENTRTGDQILCPVCEMTADTESDVYRHLVTGHRKSTIVNTLLTHSTQSRSAEDVSESPRQDSTERRF